MTPPTSDETLLRAALTALREAASQTLDLLGEATPDRAEAERRSWEPPAPEIGVAAALNGMADCFDDLADHTRFLAQRTDLIWPRPPVRPPRPR